MMSVLRLLNYLKSKTGIGLVAMLALSLTACKSEYSRYVEKELESGIRVDSLIFGMSIGQTKKDFYATCWELNKEQIISAGTGNSTARYTESPDSIQDPTRRKDMLFYGIFDENDIMQGMEMTYSYTTWSPWNKARQADSLIVDLKNVIMRDYGGNDFFSMELEKAGVTAAVKIDGNRQILIYPKSSKDVRVMMEDLNFKFKEKEGKDEKAENKENKEEENKESTI